MVRMINADPFNTKHLKVFCVTANRLNIIIVIILIFIFFRSTAIIWHLDFMKIKNQKVLQEHKKCVQSHQWPYS